MCCLGVSQSRAADPQVSSVAPFAMEGLYQTLRQLVSWEPAHVSILQTLASEGIVTINEGCSGTPLPMQTMSLLIACPEMLYMTFAHAMDRGTVLNIAMMLAHRPIMSSDERHYRMKGIRAGTSR